MIRVGTVLKGYCGGHFNRDHDDKRVEAIGADWIVVRDSRGYPHFAEVDTPEEMEKYTTPPPEA